MVDGGLRSLAIETQKADGCHSDSHTKQRAVSEDVLPSVSYQKCQACPFDRTDPTVGVIGHSHLFTVTVISVHTDNTHAQGDAASLLLYRSQLEIGRSSLDAGFMKAGRAIPTNLSMIQPKYTPTLLLTHQISTSDRKAAWYGYIRRLRVSET